jgi:hypothetical protein
VQNDADNRRLKQTILAMITGNTRHAHEPTQLLIDTTTPDGKRSGLAGRRLSNAMSSSPSFRWI